MPDRAAPPPEAGTTPDFETPLDHESGEHFKMLHNGYEGTTMVPFIAHQAWRSGAIVTRVRLTSVAPESQDSGVRGYLPALGNVRKGEAIGDDGSPLSTTGLDTRRTTVPASPSAPSAREGEREVCVWWLVDGDGKRIGDEHVSRDPNDPIAFANLKQSGERGVGNVRIEWEMFTPLASRPVSGPGTVTEAMLKDAALLAGDVAGRLDEVQSVLDRSGSVITAQNVRRCIKDLNRLAAALGGGE
jgi:hypothetical protein